MEKRPKNTWRRGIETEINYIGEDMEGTGRDRQAWCEFMEGYAPIGDGKAEEEEGTGKCNGTKKSS